MAAAEARRVEQVATVIERVPAAGQALISAQLSAAHLAVLLPVTDSSAAEALLARATVESADQFAQTVREHLIAVDAVGVRDVGRGAVQSG
jgi:hypothetical protein